MFTGLIEDIGTMIAIERKGESVLLSLRYSPVLDDLKLGDSIAVDGVCLTIIQLGGGQCMVEASSETLRRTTLGSKKPQQKVNLERALTLRDRLGGHLVTGHIDEVARIRAITPEGNTRKMVFSLSRNHIRYLVEKGSVAIDGVSLTVNEVKDDSFSVTIIPYTATHTTFSSKKVGDEVNIEVDIIGKYLEKIVVRSDTTLDSHFLSEHGFL